jgi:hypothetical protein
MGGREDLQLNMGSKETRGPGNLHIHKVLSLAEVKVAICEQKNSYKNLTGEKTQKPSEQNPLNMLIRG